MSASRKREERDARGLSRRQPLRETYAKALIVTEGRKTEPFYFEGLIAHYEISGANVEIDGRSGSSPMSVVNYGRGLYERERRDPFEKVYFVFDKNAHADYQAALNEIQNLESKHGANTFFAINSVPCFEYWLLLHYTYTTRPFAPAGKVSAAEAVIKELRRHMPGYQKADSGIFERLLDKLDTAKANAKKSLQAAESAGTDNPSTRAHELVEFLQNIKNN